MTKPKTDTTAAGRALVDEDLDAIARRSHTLSTTSRS